MNVQLVFVLAVVAAGVIALIAAFISYRKQRPEDRSLWWSNYMQAVSTNMVGSIATVILFSYLVGVAQNTAVLDELKAQLIRNLGSVDNSTALDAASELAYRGWLSDGSIERSYLGNANLRGVSFDGADLKGVVLIGANLQWAHFDDAVFDVNTVLPDGSKWTPNTDLTRFWDPDSPNFWRSSDPNSPAYQSGAGPGG